MVLCDALIDQLLVFSGLQGEEILFLARNSCGDSENVRASTGSSYTIHVVDFGQVYTKVVLVEKSLSMRCEVLRFRWTCLPDGFSI